MCFEFKSYLIYKIGIFIGLIKIKQQKKLNDKTSSMGQEFSQNQEIVQNESAAKSRKVWQSYGIMYETLLNLTG